MRVPTPPKEAATNTQMSQSQMTESAMSHPQISSGTKSQSVPVSPTKLQQSMSESTSTLQEATVDGSIIVRHPIFESATTSVLYESSIESAISEDPNVTEDVNR